MAKVPLPRLPAFLLKTKMDSINKIKNVTAPKLIIHSFEDKTVPYELGKKLFDSAIEPKKFLQISGSHNEGFFDNLEKIVSVVELFLKENGFLQE